MTSEPIETKVRTSYDPNRLFDTLLKKMQWRNDTILAQKLKVHIDVVRRIRTRTLPLGASMLLWLQEASGISIPELRQIMGDRRMRLRLSYAGRI